MFNQVELPVAPHFFPTFSITDISKIVSNTARPSNQLKDFLAKKEPFKSLLRQNLVENTETIKFAFSPQEKLLIKEYICKILNEKRLDLSLLQTCLYGSDKDKNELRLNYLQRLFEDKFRINEQISSDEIMNELELAESDDEEPMDVDNYTNEGSFTNMNLAIDQTIHADLALSMLNATPTINNESKQKAQNIYLNSKSAEIMREQFCERKQIQCSYKNITRKYTTFRITGKVSETVDRDTNEKLGIHFKTSRRMEAENIKVQNEDVVKLTCIMELGQFGKCMFVRIGYIVKEDVCEINIMDNMVKTQIFDSLENFVQQARVLTKTEFLKLFEAHLS